MGAFAGFFLGVFTGQVYAYNDPSMNASWAEQIGGAIGIVSGYVVAFLWYLTIFWAKRVAGLRLLVLGICLGGAAGFLSTAILHLGLWIMLGQIPWAFIILPAGTVIGVVAGGIVGFVNGVIAEICCKS